MDANRSQQALYYSVALVQYVHMGTSTKNFAANLNMKSIRFFYLAGNWLICNLSIFSAWLYNCSKCTLLWNGMHFAFVMDSICLLVARVLQINKPMQNFPIGLFYFLHILTNLYRSKIQHLQFLTADETNELNINEYERPFLLWFICTSWSLNNLYH